MKTPFSNTEDQLDYDHLRLSDNGTHIYCSTMESLLCIETKTRPDLYVAAGILVRNVETHHGADMAAVKRALRDLNGTRDSELMINTGSRNQVAAYADSHWAPDSEGIRKSRAAVLVKYSDAIILAACKRQKSISPSLAELNRMR